MEISLKWIPKGFILLFAVSVVSSNSEYIFEDNCKFGNETLILRASRFGLLQATSHPPYQGTKDCRLVIVPPEGHGIVLSVLKVDFRSKVRNVCQDFVKIYHSNMLSSPTTLCGPITDSAGKLSFFSVGSMTVQYHTENTDGFLNGYEDGFKLAYTAVLLDVLECVPEQYFFCRNERCIPRDLMCNGWNNCGDRSDESPVLCDTEPLVSNGLNDVVYIIVFGVLISVVVIGGVAFLAHRRRPRRDSESGSEQDEPTSRLTPYQAVHPSGFFICQNPAGPSSLYSSQVKDIHHEGGFSNPCYPSGIPQAHSSCNH